MIVNSFREDIDAICRSEGITKTAFAGKVGMQRQSLSNLERKTKIVSAKYIELMEAAGYDIELTYIRRDK